MADTRPLLLVVHTDVDPAHEDEFRAWYNEDHVPALVGQPGFIRARRYVAVEGQPKYLAIYEFEREENRKTPEYQKVRGTGPMTPYVQNMTIGVFREIFAYEKPATRKRRAAPRRRTTVRARAAKKTAKRKSRRR